MHNTLYENVKSKLKLGRIVELKKKRVNFEIAKGI